MLIPDKRNESTNFVAKKINRENCDSHIHVVSYDAYLNTRIIYMYIYIYVYIWNYVPGS